MHERVVKGILSAGNGMNLYRGCTHGCIYCDSRSRCYRMAHDFEDVEVKVNAPALLEEALRRKRARCMIGTGAMSDPYIPLEQELRLTRRCLELIAQYGFGLAIQTKSDRILRDLDLLQQIELRAKCVVQMTLTTLDERMCALVEPNVCGTGARLRALCELRERGIPTVVWLSPILPWINDTRENVLGIVEACAKAGVRGIISFGMGMTLRDGNREYYYQKLDEHFPGLKAAYARKYGLSYEIASERDGELSPLFHAACEARGMMHDREAIFRYLHAFPQVQAGEQMSFF